jgi:ankyrin repeat protein
MISIGSRYQNSDGDTPMHRAVLSKRRSMLKLMLHHELKEQQKMRPGRAAMETQVEGSSKGNMTNYDHGRKSYNIPNKYSNTPLFMSKDVKEGRASQFTNSALSFSK